MVLTRTASVPEALRPLPTQRTLSHPACRRGIIWNPKQRLLGLRLIHRQGMTVANRAAKSMAGRCPRPGTQGAAREPRMRDFLARGGDRMGRSRLGQRRDPCAGRNTPGRFHPCAPVLAIRCRHGADPDPENRSDAPRTEAGGMPRRPARFWCPAAEDASSLLVVRTLRRPKVGAPLPPSRTFVEFCERLRNMTVCDQDRPRRAASSPWSHAASRQAARVPPLRAALIFRSCAAWQVDMVISFCLLISY